MDIKPVISTILASVLLVLAGVLPCAAQFATLPLNHEEQQWYENGLLRQSHNVHTAIQPWRKSEVEAFSRKSDLLQDTLAKTGGLLNWAERKVWHEHLIRYQGDGFDVTVNPAIAGVYGMETESALYNNIYQNSRGAHVEGRLGKTVSFYSTLVESLGRFSAHTHQLTRSERVLPGYWRTKGFRDNAYDFAYAAGEVAFTPARFFHLRLGRGKQFIGEGYRSMLVSDNAVNYPFFRIETTVGKVKYVNLWAVMNDIRDEVALADDIPARKYFSMHYLSVNLGQRLNLALFEGIMWGDELRRYGFDVNFFNPVILYRPVEFAQGSLGGNVLIGLNGSFQFGHGIKMYGQLALDEFKLSQVRDFGAGNWQNMHAAQLGVKWGDALGVANLFLRAELNVARPHTYSHRDILTNWGHYAQPLAHPLGANFREALLHVHYRKGRFLANAAIHTALLGRDASSSENRGGNIYKSYDDRLADTGVFIGNGVRSQLTYFRADLHYIFNPLYNLRLQAGYQSRSEEATALGLPNSQTFYVGLRSNLYNLYQDY